MPPSAVGDLCSHVFIDPHCEQFALLEGNEVGNEWEMSGK